MALMASSASVLDGRPGRPETNSARTPCVACAQATIWYHLHVDKLVPMYLTYDDFWQIVVRE
jgi:hypothetical protein